MVFSADREANRGDALVAIMLALLLSLAWAVHDWGQLSALRLPDTDDVMRLQQIRDWLGGQRFSDLSQHRLGVAPGLAMHWSRLPDLVPATVIAALAPPIGRHAAEVAAVIAWPAMLLGLALWLIGRIATALGGREIARTAMVVAAIAYPGTTIFLPGRIDHHGLQVVLLLIIVDALVRRQDMNRGLIAGLAAAASIAIGLETLPLIALAAAVIVTSWFWRGTDEPLMGFGIALAAGLLAANIVLRTDQWLYPACDAFTATTWRVAQFAAFAPIVLGIAGHASQRRSARVALAGVAGGIVAFGLWRWAPMCLAPYSAVDPMLARLWLANVGEALPLFSARPEIAIGYAGLMVAGIVASVWRCWRTRDAGWGVLLTLQIGGFMLTCVQLRGAYAGAILAAPALAAVIADARRRGSLWLTAAWLASAGILYPLAANAFVPARSDSPRVTANCTSPAALARLAPLTGRLMAPLDLGAYALPVSRLSVVGAPYHRGNAGNAAVYRFFLGSPERARAIAAAWSVHYVALCGDSFSELGTARPASLLGAVRGGHVPRWMRPIGRPDDGLMLYRIEPRLLAGPRPS